MLLKLPPFLLILANAKVIKVKYEVMNIDVFGFEFTNSSIHKTGNSIMPENFPTSSSDYQDLIISIHGVKNITFDYGISVMLVCDCLLEYRINIHVLGLVIISYLSTSPGISTAVNAPSAEVTTHTSVYIGCEVSKVVVEYPYSANSIHGTQETTFTTVCTFGTVPNRDATAKSFSTSKSSNSTVLHLRNDNIMVLETVQPSISSNTTATLINNHTIPCQACEDIVTTPSSSTSNTMTSNKFTNVTVTGFGPRFNGTPGDGFTKIQGLQTPISSSANQLKPNHVAGFGGGASSAANPILLFLLSFLWIT